MNSLYMQQHEWILWRQYWVKKASNNAISVFHFYKVQKYAEIYININTKCRVIATSGGRHGDGRGSIEVDVPPRALAETDKFSCSPHSLEGEISLVCFSFRLPHSVLCGGVSVQLSMLCSLMGLSPVLPQSLHSKPFVIEIGIHNSDRFSPISSHPLVFSSIWSIPQELSLLSFEFRYAFQRMFVIVCPTFSDGFWHRTYITLPSSSMKLIFPSFLLLLWSILVIT